jgi:uncharacterized membrane protein YeiH
VHTLLLILDLSGTFVFALSGAGVAVRYRLDIFGVLVLAFAAGNAGGITRDLLIGATPPAAIGDWRYLAVSAGAGLLTFAAYPHVERLRRFIIVLDAGGLALFAVAGAQKALVFGLNPPMAILLGMLTGIGGGMLRDILVNEIPVVLRAELYAVAAILGASIVVIGHGLDVPATAATLVGAALCFALRIIAVWQNWHLPRR